MRLDSSLRKPLSVLTASLALAPWALATHYDLVPVDMGGGWTLFGTLDTDGTTGTLAPANILDWNITVKAVTEIGLYDKSNTANWCAGLVSDGSKLYVPTSPDGFSDGGAMTFYGGVYNQVRVADFTGAFVDGGVSMYTKGSAFDMIYLGLPNGTMHEVGSAIPFKSNQFVLNPVVFSDGTVLEGTVSTDGVVGGTSVLDWRLVCGQVWSFTFTPANSHVMAAWGVSTDGRILVVTPHANGLDGSFLIGFGTLDPTEAILADFTWMAEGVAGYVDPFGMTVLSPLPLDVNGDYVVATSNGPEVLAPYAEAILLGTKNSGGDVTSWARADDNARRVCKFIVPNVSAPIVRVDLTYSATIASPVGVALDVRARMSAAGAFKIQAFLQNQSSSGYAVLFGPLSLGLTYATFSGSLAGNLTDYVAPNGDMTARIEVLQTGPSTVALPCADFDLASLSVS